MFDCHLRGHEGFKSQPEQKFILGILFGLYPYQTQPDDLCTLTTYPRWEDEPVKVRTGYQLSHAQDEKY